MPITKLQFELGINEEIEAVMRKIASFLEQHKDEAYNLEELWQEEFGSASLPSVAAFHAVYPYEPHLYRDESVPLEQRRFIYALNKLLDHGVVQQREVSDVLYYSIGTVRLTQLLKS